MRLSRYLVTYIPRGETWPVLLTRSTLEAANADVERAAAAKVRWLRLTEHYGKEIRILHEEGVPPK